MKRKNEKRAEVLKPSPNEEANMLQSERERRKKLRLKQIRDQEKAFSRKVLQDARKRKSNELQHLTHQLKDQWQNERDEHQSQLEEKYKENLAEFGLGHNAAAQDKSDYTKQELTEEERQRAAERYQTALEQMMYDRAKMNEAETERAKAKQRALEIERLRAARIAALPTPVDPVADFYLTKDQTVSDQKDAQSFGTSHFHMQPSIHVERELDMNQEDARQAAKDEEERLQVIMEEVERDKAEQLEKARLRHKHALSLQQLEEDHKKLLEELSGLERHDRQRRQEAVAKIPVRIFQPPHKRLEDAEERQRDLEQAFEDMYMVETGYTGDVTIALEPSQHPPSTSEDSIQSASEGDERSVETHQPTPEVPGFPSTVGPDGSSERVEQEEEHITEPARGPPADAPSVPTEDPLRRLLQRIERQREQWQRRQPPQEAQPSSGTADNPLTSNTEIPPSSRRQELRIPETIPFSGDEGDVELESAEEENEEEQGRIDPAEEAWENGGDVLLPPEGRGRTLLHPLEAAQRSRATTPMDMPSAPQLSQQEALLEQQRLKLQLQQQNLLQQQLEQQLQDYHRQLAEIQEHPEAPREPLVPSEQQREPFPGRAPYGGAPYEESTLDPLEVSGVEVREPLHVRARHETAPPYVDTGTSREDSPMFPEAPESSSLESVTSDEFSSEFRRTLEAARATAERAAQVRDQERATLEELSRAPLEDVPFTNRTHPLSTSSLQSEELRSVFSPSTVTPTSVTLSSDLSVTAAMSRTSQSQVLSRDFDRVGHTTSVVRSPAYSDVTDTASVTMATSLLTKTSQNLGLFRPSSGARAYSVLSSGSELGPRVSSAVPSSRVVIGHSGRVDTGASVFTSAQATSPQISPVSFPSQPGRTTYSPGYLDYYRQKIDEERQLFEAQRDRIRQRQNEQAKRYSDLFEKTPQAYQTSDNINNIGPPVVPVVRARPGFTLQDDGNKENLGYVANSQRFRGQDKLQDISRRLDAFEKTLSHDVDSNDGRSSFRSESAYQRLPTAVSTSLYTSKPFSTSEPSYASSWTEYMSLPHASAGPGARGSAGSLPRESAGRGAQGSAGLLPYASAGRGAQGSAGSTLSSLSELTEMMTRLTSTSEDTPDEAGGDNAEPFSVVPHSAGQDGPTNVYLSRNTLGQPSTFRSSTSVTSSTDTREPLYVGVRGSERWYAPPETSTASLGAMKPPSGAVGKLLMRGSVGKQQVVLSGASTLSSLGEIVGKDMETPRREGMDDVSSDGDGDKSPLPGREETGSLESSSPTSLSSGTLRSASASGELNDFYASSGHQEQRLTGISPNSDGTSEGSSHTGTQDSNNESVSGISVEIMEHKPENFEGAVSLQDAFARRKAEFMKDSQARVEKAKDKRFQVKPRVKVKKFVRRTAANQGQKNTKKKE